MKPLDVTTAREPYHAIYLALERQRKAEKKVYSDYLGTSEEWIVLLARVWKKNYMQEYKAARRETQKKTQFRDLLEKLPWTTITEEHSKYTAAMRRQPFPNNAQYEALTDLRAISSYYIRIMQMDLTKRRMHPTVNPMRLGGDPRTRQWPSGPIQHKTFARKPTPRTKRVRHRDRRPRTRQ